MADIEKAYDNGEVTIHWKPSICTHAALCAKGLPRVFKPKERPWIQVDQAGTNELIDQVKKCPSGALSFSLNEKQEDQTSVSNESVSVQIFKNGPMIVKGNFQITHADNTVEEKKNSTAFCRCGASQSKPYCDGAHKKVGFLD